MPARNARTGSAARPAQFPIFVDSEPYEIAAMQSHAVGFFLPIFCYLNCDLNFRNLNAAARLKPSGKNRNKEEMPPFKLELKRRF